MNRRYWVGIILLAVMQVSGCGGVGSGKPPTIGSVTLTNKVDEVTKAPLTQVTSFPKDSTLLYASVKTLNPSKGTKVEAKWYHKGLPVDTASVTFDQKGDRYVAFSIVAKETFPSGDYKVEIALDGKVAQEVNFVVE